MQPLPPPILFPVSFFRGVTNTLPHSFILNACRDNSCFRCLTAAMPKISHTSTQLFERPLTKLKRKVSASIKTFFLVLTSKNIYWNLYACKSSHTRSNCLLAIMPQHQSFILMSHIGFYGIYKAKKYNVVISLCTVIPQNNKITARLVLKTEISHDASLSITPCFQRNRYEAKLKDEHKKQSHTLK